MNTIRHEIVDKNYDGYSKYDQVVAETYEKSRNVERHWLREDAFVGNYVKSHKIQSLLDIPVGTGRFLEHFLEIPKVVGVDISDDMLKVAREKKLAERGAQQVQLQKGDVFDLQFEDAEFDCVVVFRLFHLLPPASLRKAIRELCRVARKDIVVQTYIPMTVKQRRWCKIINQVKSFFLVKKDQIIASDQPWLHIQAYDHTQDIFDAEFVFCEFYPRITKRLDIYGRYEVRATVYSRKN